MQYQPEQRPTIGYVVKHVTGVAQLQDDPEYRRRGRVELCLN